MEKHRLDCAVVGLMEEISGIARQVERQPEPDNYRKGWRDAISEVLLSNAWGAVLVALTEAGWTAPRTVWSPPEPEGETDG